jgi:hypothetical protein
VKRVLDIVGAGLGLMILSPVLLIVALMIRRQMGSPVLFRQTRPGLHGKPFQMIKFRTMRDALDAEGKPLPDSERITRLGRLPLNVLLTCAGRRHYLARYFRDALKGVGQLIGADIPLHIRLGPIMCSV